MIDWRNEILSRLSTEESKYLKIFAIRCANFEELKKLKDEISLLKKEGIISLYFATPEEVLDAVNSYYRKEGKSVDEEYKNMWLKSAEEDAEDLKVFFENFARLKKK